MNVVYVIECTKCSIQCIGETENALCVCLTGHRSDIRHKRMEKSVAKHFNSVDHSIKELTIMMIETIHREDTEYRRREPLDRDDQIPGSGWTKPLFINHYSHSVSSRQWDFGGKLIYSVPTFYQGFRIKNHTNFLSGLPH